jgi:hypothetical protein
MGLARRLLDDTFSLVFSKRSATEASTMKNQRNESLRTIKIPSLPVGQNPEEPVLGVEQNM